MIRHLPLLLTLAAPLFCRADIAPIPTEPLTPAAKTEEILKGAVWTQLFDGKSLAGWKGSGYEVQDGAIVCTPKGSFLHTEKEYGDFVLDFQFKLQPGSNNGIGLRYPGTGDAAYAGMEIQVLDDRHEKYKGLQEWQYHGSVYNIQPSLQARKNCLKPTGEWNHETIVCIGDHIKVILNGETITDCFLGDIKFDPAKHPGALRKSGFIAFCGHGDYVAYKDLKVADYTAAPALPKSSGDNQPPAGFTALFNGTDLNGWQGMVGDGNPYKRRAMSPEALAAAQTKANESAKTHWKVADGALVFDGKGQNLCTAKPYGDFEVYVDWKIPATADSGLYLRSTPQVQIWDPGNPAQNAAGNQKGSGGLWNNSGPGKAGKDPLVKADKPIGEWNTFCIRMIGDRVTIHLNGQLVVDNQILENYWKRGSKLLREEFFELQNHGNNLWFKNIYLRELPY
ncbi:MAG: DUF1080 domain-containing protein [Verrucomicrobiales bacterium]|nr:DUF1080 domain-containing protein [Verrucomicrobiales bacterium]